LQTNVLQYFIKAARLGDPHGHHYLGLMAEYGLAGPEDFTAAVGHYQSAIGQQHVESMYNLALMYAYGRGVEQDYPKAAQLFDTAAHQHQHPAALYFLGMMHTHGHGVQLDYNLALHMFKLAALSSHPVAADAQAHVAELEALISAAGASDSRKGEAGSNQLVADAMSVLSSNGKPISGRDISTDSSGRLTDSVRQAAERARRVGEALAVQQALSADDPQ